MQSRRDRFSFGSSSHARLVLACWRWRRNSVNGSRAAYHPDAPGMIYGPQIPDVQVRKP